VISIDHDSCNGCGFCVENCPTLALQLVNGVVEIDETICQGCEICINICPQGAIRLSEVIENKYSMVTAVPPLHGEGCTEELPDIAIVKPPSQRSTDVITKPQASLGDSLGAVLTFLVHDIAPVLEDFLKPKQQHKTNPTTTQSHYIHSERGRGAGKRRRGRQVRRHRRRRR
jgi:ferredoxin